MPTIRDTRPIHPVVIASEAKQSIARHVETWIASSLHSLAQRFAFSQAMTARERSAPFPSPLVGEGGIGGRSAAVLRKDADALHRLWTRSGGETDEGSVSACGVCICGENPSSGASRHLLPQGEKGKTPPRTRTSLCDVLCDCPTGKSLKTCPALAEKYSASRSPQITRTTPPIPRPQEGRIAIVTDVGCGERWPQSAGRAGRFSQGGLRSVSESRAPTNGVDADGKAVWSWRPLLVSSRRRFCKSNRVCQSLQSAGDGGKRNSSPGRARYKP